jgi:hypothetical protein
MLGFNPFARSFLIDAIAIINVKPSGSAKFIIPAVRMFSPSFGWG